MEQRPLRVGDVVDDYCPRERRITNHAIVALVGEVIRQTRCQTCDAEHVYKEARMPRRRKKGDPEGLYEQVLSDVAGSLVPPSVSDEGPPEVTAAASDGPDDTEPTPADESVEAAIPDLAPGEDLWTGHRRLIRASLPRSESDPPPARPIPEFTMHQRQRGHGFRSQGWSGSQGNGNGNTNGNHNGNRAPQGGGRHRHGGGGGGRQGSRGHGRRGR